MSVRSRVCLFFAFGAIGVAQTPDMILIDGKILTVDAKDSVAEAVAIAKGKIVAVGQRLRSNDGPAQPRASSICTVSPLPRD